ncbi:MAG TPA: GNAT family N-acetyltransferase [Candidatus Limnocylindrales bacterium]|nr:GNAT family N-acetyltransferase [Candidatus Limnocylindrales bacterium]
MPLIRDARPDDIGGIRSILAAHGNDGPVVVADIIGPYVAHLLTRGRARVAEIDGELVGFGAGLDTGRSVHLADLFVHPDRLGRGIGRPLLASVFEGAAGRTTFASEDERALPLYVRAGMQPLWPSLYVQGQSASLPETGGALSAEPATGSDLAALERDWTGIDRSVDHAYWARMADAEPFVIRGDGAIAALGYGRARQAAPIRVLDRLVIHRDADPVATTIAAMRQAARGGPVLVCLGGPHPALRPLLEAGFRIVDRDQFLASDPTLVDPVRLIPNPGML